MLLFMKRIISIVTLLLLFGAANPIFGQTDSDGTNIDIKYRSFGHYSDIYGNKLSKMDLKQVLSSYEYSDYLAAKRKMNTGFVLTGVGVGAFALSAVAINAQVEDINANIATMFMIPVMIGGTVCMAIGIPKTLVARHKFKAVAKEHNANNDVSLTWGPTQNGVGFALNF